MTATTTVSSRSDQAEARAASEERAGAVQRTIADTFDAEKVSSEMTRKWILLACSDSEVHSAGGITLRLTDSEAVDPAYGKIRSEFSADPLFTVETNRTGKGLERLALSPGTGTGTGTGKVPGHCRQRVADRPDRLLLALQSPAPCPPLDTSRSLRGVSGRSSQDHGPGPSTRCCPLGPFLPASRPTRTPTIPET